MAKRYDNDFDAESFVENFRAQDGTPASPSKTIEESSTPTQSSANPAKAERKSAKDAQQKHGYTVEEYIARFLDDLSYKKPKARFPQVGIHPEFVKAIQRMKDLNGVWGSSISTYINNVLAAHFDEYRAVIDDLTNNSYRDE